MFGEYREKCVSSNLMQDDVFCGLVMDGMLLMGLTDIEVSREFGVSDETSKRWRQGSGAPQMDVRRALVSWLAGKAYPFWLLEKMIHE